jgi:hypothetical protein
VGSGREPEHQDARVGIAEARDWFSPIFPIDVGAALLARDFLPIFDQARTTSTRDHFAVQSVKPGRHAQHCIRNSNARHRTEEERLLTHGKFCSRFLHRSGGVINPPVRFHYPPEVTFVTLLRTLGV